MTDRVSATHKYLSSKGLACEIKSELSDTQDGNMSVSGTNIEIDIGPDYYNVVIVSDAGFAYPFTGNNVIQMYCSIERLMRKV